MVLKAKLNKPSYLTIDGIIRLNWLKMNIALNNKGLYTLNQILITDNICQGIDLLTTSVTAVCTRYLACREVFGFVT